MRKRSAVSLGPGAPSLILIFVVLALSMLSMLALMNGRNDARLSDRSVQVAEAVYALNVQAEESLAQLDQILSSLSVEPEDASQTQVPEPAEEPADAEAMANSPAEAFDAAALAALLPSNMELDGDTVRWTETDGVRNLHCAVRILPAAEPAQNPAAGPTQTPAADPAQTQTADPTQPPTAASSGSRLQWVQHTLVSATAEAAEEEDMFEW